MNYIPVNKTTTPGDMRKSAPVVQGEPPMERKVTPANVRKYISAEASLHLHGPVPQEVFEDRKSKCIACPKRMVTDKIPDEIGFCASCGCGISQRARLTVKLTMPDSSCPLGKWGRAEGRHPRIIDRIKSSLARMLIG